MDQSIPGAFASHRFENPGLVEKSREVGQKRAWFPIVPGWLERSLDGYPSAARLSRTVLANVD